MSWLLLGSWFDWFHRWGRLLGWWNWLWTDVVGVIMGWLPQGVFCEIIEVWFWLPLAPFLVANRFFMLTSWLCAMGWSLLLIWVISRLRWSRIRLRLFLGSIPRVLFIGSPLTYCVVCALSYPLQLFGSNMCFTRLTLLLIFWLIGHVLGMSVGIFLLPKIFLPAY